jgi:hypothetical protein
MAQYLLSVITPTEGIQPDAEALAAIMAEVAAVRSAMISAGVWVFAGGLDAPSTATVVRAADHPEAGLLLTDGPFIEGKEYVGGFTIIDVPDLDAALVWGGRTTTAIGLPIEVRPFHVQPDVQPDAD